MLRLCVQAHDGEEVPFIWFWPERFLSCAIVTHDVEAVEGRDFCPPLMDIDESFGIKSSFQLIPEQRYALSLSFIESIRSRGFEVNVHDLNHDDGCLPAKQISAIGQAALTNTAVRLVRTGFAQAHFIAISPGAERLNFPMTCPCPMPHIWIHNAAAAVP